MKKENMQKLTTYIYDNVGYYETYKDSVNHVGKARVSKRFANIAELYSEVKAMQKNKDKYFENIPINDVLEYLKSNLNIYKKNNKIKKLELRQQNINSSEDIVTVLNNKILINFSN